MSFILLEFYSIQIRKPISYLKVLYYSNFTGFPIITLLRNPRHDFIVAFFVYMSFRTILIDKPARLYLDLNNIVVHCEDKYWINLDEINTIIIDDLRCNITLKLLSLLCERGINVIITNNSHMPVGCVETLYNHSRSSKNIKNQINWKNEYKINLWTIIVKQKIKNQIYTLINHEKKDKIEMLTHFFNDVKLNDVTNREGLTSRVYFKELFGNNFKRFNEDMINYSLNYSYQIIRAKISQEIVSLGYITAIGINHRSEYNQFNLSDDLIEVYRPIIDYYVYKLLLDCECFSSSFKEKLVNILNEIIKIDGKEYKIHNSITIYLQSVFTYLLVGDLTKLKFPELK